MVLEENKSLEEQIDLLKSRLNDAQKNSIIESKFTFNEIQINQFNFKCLISCQVNHLSKRIIMLESEKLDLRNQYENLKLNHDDLLRRLNDVSTEAQSRVRLQDHLNQTGELKR